MTEIQVSLTLIGDKFDINTITNAIGVNPTYVRKRDEVLGNGELFGHYEWGVETELIQTDDLSNIPEQLILSLPCSLDVLAQIAKENKAQWNILILINVNDSFPSICFSPEFIKMAGYIGAAIGFDVYLWTK